MSDREYRQQTQSFQQRQFTQKLSGDAGYAERFHSLYGKDSPMRRYALRRALRSLAGLVVICVLIAGVLAGYLREALVMLVVFAWVVFLGMVIAKMGRRYKRNQMYKDHIDRQNGFDRRFGRAGAPKRKKKRNA